MSGFQPGDLVVKVGGPCTIIPRGSVHRVEDVHPGCDGGGLVIPGYRDPATCACFYARNFRKLNDGTDDAELIARIKSCEPVANPQREDA